MLFHIGAFALAVDSQHQSVWHRLTPRTRLLCVLLFVFAIALTPNGHWWSWAIYGTAIVLVLGLSRITISVLLQRVIVEFAFVGVVLVGTLFRGGGQVLWTWGPLQVGTEGLMILGSVALKSGLCLLCLNLLTLTTPVPALLQALVTIRVPTLLVAILASMYRYLGVLVDEFSAMRRAATSRNLMGSHPRVKRLVIGNMIGSLFIRTYERGERVHQAMVSRGYTGLPTIHALPIETVRDGIALTVTLVIALLGQAIYLF
jgi:cobalt/nickel transport system permease protein